MDVKIEPFQFADGSADLVIVDLHGYTLYEVKTDLPHLIREHLDSRYQKFHIIHGYQSGQILQNYVRNKLIKQLRLEVNSITNIRKWKESEGDTFLIIDF